MVQSEASSRASSRTTSERPGASRTPQPPAKRRRGNRSEEADECFVREMTRLDERRADREERGWKVEVHWMRMTASSSYI